MHICYFLLSSVRRVSTSGKLRFWLIKPLAASLLLSTAAMPAAAFAQVPPPASPSLQVSSAPATANAPDGRRMDFFSVGFDDQSFLDRANPPAGIKDYTMITGRIRSHLEHRLIDGAFDLGGAFATSIENYSYVEVPEAFLNYLQPDKTFEITVGRRKYPWSGLDHDWQLGIWQPLNRFNYLDPTEQGLAGLFGNWHVAGTDVTLFGSPLYFPEQGAPYQLHNGELTSQNPWFSKPPNSVSFFPSSPISRIQFDLETPSVSSVINQPSIGVLIRTENSEQPGIYAQAAFMRKPRNQLALPFETILRILDSDSYGEVRVYPRIEFHRLASLDFGYHGLTWSSGFSALYDGPEHSPAPTNLDGVSTNMTYQTLKPGTFLSPYLQVQLFASRAWSPVLRLTTLHLVGGQVETQGKQISAGGAFGSRSLYQRAIGFSEESLIMKNTSWSLSQSLRLIQETAEQGTILMARLNVAYTTEWLFTLSATLLGSARPEEDTNEFIARFRGNDSIGASLQYVF
jgi:hypothetical protein